MKEIPELLAAAEDIRKQAKYLAFEENRWELHKTSGNINIYRCPSPIVGYSIKGETEINCPLEHIYDFLYPSTDYYKLRWDPHVSRVEILQEVSHDVAVCHYIYKQLIPGIVSARDGIHLLIQCLKDDFLSVEMGSVEHDDYPPCKKYIRAIGHPSGFYAMKTDKPNVCKIVSVLQTFDMGSTLVPRALIDAAVPYMVQQFMEGVHKMEQMKWTPFDDIPFRRAKDSVIDTKPKIPDEFKENDKQ